MKKKIIAAVLVALLVIAAVVLIVYGQKTSDSGREMTQSVDSANFNMQYSDRLAGVTVTNVKSNSSTIEVTYGDAGYCRKTLGVADNSDNRSDLDEEVQQDITGYRVTLKGKGGSYYLATWSYNSFAYTISIDGQSGGVSLDEMTEYIKATR